MALYGGARSVNSHRINTDSSGVSTANIAGFRPAAGPLMDSRHRTNLGRADSSVSTAGHGTRNNLADCSNVSNSQSKREPKYVKDEPIATREVEFIQSFPVTGDDQDAKTEFVRKYLLEIKGMCNTTPVLLVISLSGIKVSTVNGETTLMAHALKRIAFATCFPEHKQFSFIAREPKASADEQYCHAFLARSAREAEELNNLVANAFRTAYTQSQPVEPVLSTTSSTGFQQPPLTPLPSSSPLLNGPVELCDRRGTGGDVLACRLTQISTAHVDKLANDRRQRRHRQLSADAADRRVMSPQQQLADGLPAPACTPRKSHDQNEHGRSNSESPPSTNGCVQPSSSSAVPTAVCNGAVTSTADSGFMSNILKVLRGNGTDQRPHGSPVMILKELIDRHFNGVGGLSDLVPNNAGGLADMLPSTLVTSHSRPVALDTSTVTSAVASCESNVVTRSSPSSRPRPLSDAFISNDAGFLRSQNAENGIVAESSARMESQRPANKDEDLRSAAWYQPGVPRETVLDMLAQQSVGAFVVRDSATHAGCYALSIRVPKYETDQGIAHYLITKTSRGTVRLKGMAKEWNSLSSLVTHHTVMRELLPCLLVLPRNSSSVALNGVDRLDKSNSEC